MTAKPGLDARRVRADFPIFEHPVHGRPLAYLDSAASAQKPRQVLDAMRDFYETSYANIHRGVYELAERATDAYEAARETTRAFVNAPAAREIVFTRNVTAALNAVAYGWGLDNFGPGDLVLATEMEHHSNFVPWQYVAGRTGADFAAIPVDGAGELRLEDLERVLAGRRLKLLACTAVSNSLGTINPVPQLADWAHEHGAVVVVDAAQAAPHRRLDVQALGADFVGFTGHKVCGPTGIGVLWGRADVLERMSPFELGGHMIRKVTVERTTWNEIPHRFEAGTAPIAEAVGLAAALDYVSGIGLEAIERHESELTEYALGQLAEVEGLRVFGPPADRRVGIVSFELEGVHPHDVAQIVDAEGVAVRAGHHCNQPLMARLGVAATTRASFYLYTLPEEIDRLVEGLVRARTLFR
ncbi:MAG TPA: SufS family cysteine desulfurase [Gaiellaceae bacterium]|nr:SufS family cysteine desulfurase [Gaiellaceae bacterium]